MNSARSILKVFLAASHPLRLNRTETRLMQQVIRLDTIHGTTGYPFSSLLRNSATDSSASSERKSFANKK